MKKWTLQAHKPEPFNHTEAFHQFLLIMSSLQFCFFQSVSPFDHHLWKLVQDQADWLKILSVQNHFNSLFFTKWIKLKHFSPSRKSLTRSFFDTVKERSDNWSKTRKSGLLIFLNRTQRNRQSGSLNQQFKNSFSQNQHRSNFIS